MAKVDRRGRLSVEPFRFQRDAAESIRVFHGGRLATTLRGESARRFLAAIEGADTQAAQLLMAKATGNFKRGNERP